MKEPKQVEGHALGEKIHWQALERIAALIGYTEDLPEERELIHWAEISDRYERGYRLP